MGPNPRFVCRGLGPAVPRFLRLDGKVRNQSMQKGECERLIKDFWKFKKQLMQKSPRSAMVDQSLQQQLYEFLKEVRRSVVNFCPNARAL